MSKMSDLSDIFFLFFFQLLRDVGDVGDVDGVVGVGRGHELTDLDVVGADTPGSLGASLNSHPTTQIALTRRDRVKIPPVPHPPCSG